MAVKLDITKVLTMPADAVGAFAFSRTGYFRLLTLGLFLVLVGATLVVQLNGGQRLVEAERNFVAQEEIVPPRGLFYDRNGVRLVKNELAYSLYLRTKGVTSDTLDDLLSKMEEVRVVDRASIKNNFELLRDNDTLLLLVAGVSQTEKLVMEGALEEFPVSFKATHVRDYLYGAYLGHVLGYTGLATELDVKAGAAPTDIVGKYRLEKIWQDELKGQPGRLVRETDGGVRTVAETPGNNVVSTIDIRWQIAMRNLVARQVERLGAQSGAAVIVDVSNGEVWAHVGYPDFDPNLFTQGMTVAKYQELLSDRRQPLIDKVASSQLAPGSSFKVITAYGLLQNGIIDSNTHVFSTGCMQISAGFPFCEFGKYYLGDLDITRALTRSSNIFFCENIMKLSAELGFDRFVASAQELGIGTVTGSGLDLEAAGVVASPAYKETTFKEKWYVGDACNAVIGQGFTVVTPLQMAMAVATIYNGGNYYKPLYVRQVQDQEGRVLKEDFTEVLRKVEIKPETVALIAEGMREVVTSPEGTAYWHLHNMPGEFTGKSGSAQAFVYEGGVLVEKVNGWLIGTFDYNGRKYAFAIAIGLGGGGWYASEIMMQFANCLFNDFYPGCEG
ncbi:MAG: hypothetical protein JNK26_03335 [Candidatus Doudnabacteria bacterium]|nr:hypothetical protein [Candidatus Doudnabacteria bacterium]